MSDRSVTVVIPCMNEAESLPGVLERIPDGYRVIVVDNNSTDETSSVAETAGATVVLETIPGYGAAVHAGVLAADTEIVCVLDGDGSMDPRDLPSLVDALDHADLAVGRRAAGNSPLHARVGNALLSLRLRTKYHLPVHDLGAIRAVRRQALLELQVTDRRSGYPLQLLVLASQAGWGVVELPVSYRSRTAGVSKVSGSVRGTISATRDFWKALS